MIGRSIALVQLIAFDIGDRLGVRWKVNSIIWAAGVVAIITVGSAVSLGTLFGISFRWADAPMALTQTIKNASLLWGLWIVVRQITTSLREELREPIHGSLVAAIGIRPYKWVLARHASGYVYQGVLGIICLMAAGLCGGNYSFLSTAWAILACILVGLNITLLQANRPSLPVEIIAVVVGCVANVVAMELEWGFSSVSVGALALLILGLQIRLSPSRFSPTNRLRRQKHLAQTLGRFPAPLALSILHRSGTWVTPVRAMVRRLLTLTGVGTVALSVFQASALGGYLKIATWPQADTILILFTTVLAVAFGETAASWYGIRPTVRVLRLLAELGFGLKWLKAALVLGHLLDIVLLWLCVSVLASGVHGRISIINLAFVASCYLGTILGQAIFDPALEADGRARTSMAGNLVGIMIGVFATSLMLAEGLSTWQVSALAIALVGGYLWIIQKVLILESYSIM